MLAETVWTRGKIKKGTKRVNLWLGANTMVEYSLEEAGVLLNKNKENALANLKSFVILSLTTESYY